jgi:hypothetical protein
MQIARGMAGVSRLYWGAEYFSDRQGPSGERVYVYARAFWVRREDAQTDQEAPPDVAILWESKENKYAKHL